MLNSSKKSQSLNPGSCPGSPYPDSCPGSPCPGSCPGSQKSNPNSQINCQVRTQMKSLLELNSTLLEYRGYILEIRELIKTLVVGRLTDFDGVADLIEINQGWRREVKLLEKQILEMSVVKPSKKPAKKPVKLQFEFPAEVWDLIKFYLIGGVVGDYRKSRLYKSLTVHQYGAVNNMLAERDLKKGDLILAKNDWGERVVYQLEQGMCRHRLEDYAYSRPEYGGEYCINAKCLGEPKEVSYIPNPSCSEAMFRYEIPSHTSTENLETELIPCRAVVGAWIIPKKQKYIIEGWRKPAYSLVYPDRMYAVPSGYTWREFQVYLKKRNALMNGLSADFIPPPEPPVRD